LGVTWERIIMDEANMVQKYNNHTSKALIKLKGVSIWCVTGTPL
jgi:hypothetical protein